MTAAGDDSAGTEAVVRKPPRKEPAGSEARCCLRAMAIWLERWRPPGNWECRSG